MILFAGLIIILLGTALKRIDDYAAEAALATYFGASVFAMGAIVITWQLHAEAMR